MKEVLSNQTSSSYSNHFVNNNGETNSNSVSNGTNSTRKYAALSTDWISAIGEELGIHSLPDTLLKKLAEDASYRLREVLHVRNIFLNVIKFSVKLRKLNFVIFFKKCVTRLRHSKRRRLTATDVNAVVTNLCDVDPLIGAPEQLPEYISEASLFVPHERFIDLTQKINEPPSFSQVSVPFLQGKMKIKFIHKIRKIKFIKYEFLYIFRN